MTTVRETKRADELKTGDWLALEGIGGHTSPAEIAALVPFQPRGEHEQIEIVYRKPNGGIDHWQLVSDGRVPLATEAEIAALRERSERAQRIADIRSYADWLEANPDLPMPYGLGGQTDIGDRDNCGLAEIAVVRAFAEKFGAELRELDDRTVAYHKIGSVRYDVIAWHKDGRPAEPEPKPVDEAKRCVASLHVPAQTDDARCFRCGATGVVAAYVPDATLAPAADPTGLAYSRADDADDPTPVSGARVVPHVGGVTEDGLVDETKPEPVHFDDAAGVSMCGLAAVTPHKASQNWAEVTCETCYDEVPF